MAQETREKRVYDTSLCPLPVNTAPNPQFAPETAICQQPPPRTSSQRVAFKRDENPNSATFGQWLLASGGYSNIRIDAFPYDSDPVACPLPVAKTLRLNVTYQNCAFRVSAIRSDAPFAALTIDFVIQYINNQGQPQLFDTGSVTIPTGQTDGLTQINAPIDANTLYIVSNVIISDSAYPVPGTQNIPGTPTQNPC